MFSPWYIIKTNPNAERKATTELRRAGIRVYLPKRSYVSGRRQRRHHAPILTGYVLIRFPTPLSVSGFSLARDCDGVRDFVRWRSKSGDLVPVPVPDLVVREFIMRQRGREFDDEAMKRAWREAQRAKLVAAAKAGDEVRITEGPFASLLATITELEDEGAWVLVEAFGRKSRIHIDLTAQSIEPVEKAA